MAGDPDAALPLTASPAPPSIDDHRASATARTASVTASPTSPATSAAPPRRRSLIDNNPPAHPRALTLAGGEGWRRVNDFDLSWANPDQGRGQPDLRAPPGGSPGPAGYDTGRPVRGRRRTSPRSRTARCRRRRLRSATSGCATKRATTRRRLGVEVPLRFDDVPPGVAFEAGDGAEHSRSRSAPTVTDAHSGPAAGRSPTGASTPTHWIELPTQARGRARTAGTGGPDRAACPISRRAPTSSGPTPPTGPATPPRRRCAPTAPRWRSARRRRPVGAEAGRPARRGRRRGSSPGCAAATGAATR